MSTNPHPATLDYAVVDVFAEHPFEGNPLAIFADGNGLSTDQMQALARETNLSETTFILPDPSDTDSVRVRIFTTREELPFAGHPTLGTASWLYRHHPTLQGAETITLRLNAGPVVVRFNRDDGQGTCGTMTQPAPVFGATHDPAEVAAVLNVPVDALGFADLDPALPIQVVSTGMPFCLVPFRSLEALSQLDIPLAAAQPWLDRAGAKFFYAVTQTQPGQSTGFTARMQFYGSEDPATGSAAGCAIAWLVRHGVVPSGQATVIEQGAAVLRPSRIHVQGLELDNQQMRVLVGGRTIQVASGCFFRP
jgi:trans-2,3-dihydro-3-hydroxyanthranilate isomerase